MEDTTNSSPWDIYCHSDGKGGFYYTTMAPTANSSFDTLTNYIAWIDEKDNQGENPARSVAQ